MRCALAGNYIVGRHLRGRRPHHQDRRMSSLLLAQGHLVFQAPIVGTCRGCADDLEVRCASLPTTHAPRHMARGIMILSLFCLIRPMGTAGARMAPGSHAKSWSVGTSLPITSAMTPRPSRSVIVDGSRTRAALGWAHGKKTCSSKGHDSSTSCSCI